MLQHVVVKTPRTVPGSNLLIVGIPLGIITLFCAAYLGFKTHTPGTTASSSTSVTTSANALTTAKSLNNPDLLAPVTPALIIPALSLEVAASSTVSPGAAGGELQPAADTSGRSLQGATNTKDQESSAPNLNSSLASPTKSKTKPSTHKTTTSKSKTE